MIKAIIFDADGVLINAEMFSYRYERDTGVPRAKLLPFFDGPMKDCLTGKADLKQELTKHLQEWGWEKSIEELLRYWFESEHKINEQMIEEIRGLKSKGIICCLGTNQEKYRTEYMLNEMGFAKVFDKNHIFSSARVGHKKPHTAFFQHIVDSLQLPKNEILFWDDTQEHIDSAKSFGIHAEFFSAITDFKEKMKRYLS